MLAAERPPLIARGRALAAAAAARLVAVRPVYLLLPLCLLQIGIGAIFAWGTPHNGWVWYSGGDATEYWTGQWSLAHGFLPRSVLGYGLPVAYAWVPLVAGTTLIQGLAVIAPLQLAVLVPLALVCLWGVADQLFGRLYAWGATALFVAAPLLMLLGFHDDYHQAFDQYFLVPHWFGMTNMGDLPSLVTVLAAAWATLRAVDRRSPSAAIVGGVVAGFAIGVKPANGVFVLAVAALFLAARSWRIAAVWTVALLPAVLTLALWKQRGLGTLPILAVEGGAHLAAGAGSAAVVGAAGLGRYFSPNFSHVHGQLVDLREVFWSIRLLEFLGVAGLIGAFRRSPAKAAFLAVWFGGYCVFKATSNDSNVSSASYFRLAEPGLAAYVLLIASIVYLLPGTRRLVTAAVPASFSLRRAFTPPVTAAVVLLALVPLVFVAAVSPPGSMRTVRDENVVQETPLVDALHFRARRAADGTVALSWRKPSTGSTSVWFVVHRSPTPPCVRPSGGADQCTFNLPIPVLATTQGTSAVDRPGTARPWYYVSMGADYRRSTVGGDLMLVSPAVQAPPA